MATASAQPGQIPLDPELLRRVRRLEIKVRRLVNTIFLGGYHSVFRGRGIEFSDFREYQPGDDIRIIDWNVTARMGTPYVKKYVEERELTVMLVADLSASSLFSSALKTRRELAAEMCALLAFSAVRNNDKVGLIAFSDRVEKFVPPRKGREHALRVLRELLYLSPQGRCTDITEALRYLNRVVKRRSVVFLFSDFIDNGYEAVLRATARRHDVVALMITDPREMDLPPVGILALEDAETGQAVLVDTGDPRVISEYRRIADLTKRNRDRTFKSVKAGKVDVSTDSSYVEPLMAFFRQKAKR